MAMLIGRMHAKGAGQAIRANQAGLSEDEFVHNIPDHKVREEDLKMGLLLNGCWQERRVVITKDAISFALVGDDVQIDYIPLAEVDYVRDMSERKDSIAQSEGDGAGLYANALQIATNAEGYNSGRSYFLKANSRGDSAKLCIDITKLVKAAKKRVRGETLFLKYQYVVRKIYASRKFQGVVAFFITANFFTSIVETQYINDLTTDDDEPTNLGNTLNSLNLFFTFLFTAELAMNLFAYWCKPFFQNAWNWIDMFVVVMSLSAVAMPSSSGGIVRIIRALRVIRIFGRLKALKKIISALTSALNPVVNVFIILFLLIAISAIVAVTLFRDDDPDNFGRFDNAFLAMFDVVAGEGWPDTLPKFAPDGTVNPTVSLFTVAFTIIVNWVILQVSVAVLLDNFISASARIEEQEKLFAESQKLRDRQTKCALEPLLLKLAREYTSSQDLSERLSKLYQVLDTDKSGSLSSKEFCAALKKLDFSPRIHISHSDFMSITMDGTLLDENGQLGLREFDIAMRKEIKVFTQSRLSLVSESRTQSDSDFMQFGAIKMLVMDQLKMSSEHEELKSAVHEILHHIRGKEQPQLPVYDTVVNDCDDVVPLLLVSEPVTHLLGSRNDGFPTPAPDSISEQHSASGEYSREVEQALPTHQQHPKSDKGASAGWLSPRKVVDDAAASRSAMERMLAEHMEPLRKELGEVRAALAEMKTPVRRRIRHAFPDQTFGKTDVQGVGTFSGYSNGADMSPPQQPMQRFANYNDVIILRDQARSSMAPQPRPFRVSGQYAQAADYTGQFDLQRVVRVVPRWTMTQNQPSPTDVAMSPIIDASHPEQNSPSANYQTTPQQPLPDGEMRRWAVEASLFMHDPQQTDGRTPKMVTRLVPDTGGSSQGQVRDNSSSSVQRVDDGGMHSTPRTHVASMMPRVVSGNLVHGGQRLESSGTLQGTQQVVSTGFMQSAPRAEGGAFMQAAPRADSGGFFQTSQRSDAGGYYQVTQRAGNNGFDEQSASPGGRWIMRATR